MMTVIDYVNKYQPISATTINILRTEFKRGMMPYYLISTRGTNHHKNEHNTIHTNMINIYPKYSSIITQWMLT